MLLAGVNVTNEVPVMSLKPRVQYVSNKWSRSGMIQDPWCPAGTLPVMMILTLSDFCHKMITGERKEIQFLTRKCNKSRFPETQNYDTDT